MHNLIGYGRVYVSWKLLYIMNEAHMDVYVIVYGLILSVTTSTLHHLPLILMSFGMELPWLLMMA